MQRVAPQPGTGQLQSPSECPILDRKTVPPRKPDMLRHIVLVTLNPEASDAQVADWRAATRQMCETSPDVLSYTFGENVGSGPNHHDAAIVADFEDMAAFRRYVSGPIHAAYVEDHARHVVTRLAAIQHEV